MIKTTEKTMTILSVIADARYRPVTPKKIAEKAQITASACSHILKTLLVNGYVEKVSHNAGYILGPQTYYLTRFGKYEQDLISICRPVMNYLAQKTGDAVILATIKNYKKFIIETIDPTHNTFKDYQQVREDSIYRTATGRLLLAHMDRWDLEEIYNHYGKPTKEDFWPSINSFNDFRNEISKINVRQIIKIENIYKDICATGYALPLYRNKKCVAALGLSCIFPIENTESFLREEQALKNTFIKAVQVINGRIREKN